MAARTILVADEDRDTRIILRAVLERHDFEIIEAANADDACVAAQQRALDLVILNYPMAAADGRTLVHHLRAQPATRDVPILNLTSRVVPQFLRQAAAEGVTLTVSKPIDAVAVVRVVSDILAPIASHG